MLIVLLAGFACSLTYRAARGLLSREITGEVISVTVSDTPANQ